MKQKLRTRLLCSISLVVAMWILVWLLAHAKGLPPSHYASMFASYANAGALVFSLGAWHDGWRTAASLILASSAGGTYFGIATWVYTEGEWGTTLLVGAAVAIVATLFLLLAGRFVHPPNESSVAPPPARVPR